MNDTESIQLEEDDDLVDNLPAAIDMEALAEKILSLLRREIEIESERNGKYSTGR